MTVYWALLGLTLNSYSATAPAIPAAMPKSMLQTSISKGQQQLFTGLQNQTHWDYPSYLGTQYISQYWLFLQWLGKKDPLFDTARFRTELKMQQLADGSWAGIRDLNNLKGDLNATVLNYWALKTMDHAEDRALTQNARTWILKNGGIEQTTALVRVLLALFGNESWDFLPRIPEFLFGHISPVRDTDLAQWIGPHLLPISYLKRFEVSKDLGPLFRLDELRTQSPPKVRRVDPGEWEGSHSWITKIINAQQPRGTWGGYTVASLFALVALDDAKHRIATRSLAPSLTLASERAFRTIQGFYFGPHSSAYLGVLDDGHYWDTALAINAILDDESLVVSKKVSTQILGALQYLSAAQTKDGGIPFGFDFEYAPDTDDTALTVQAWIKAARAGVLKTELAQPHIEKALKWLSKMQNRDGGWGAFSKDNTGNAVIKSLAQPFANAADLFDESSPDVTGHILEAYGMASADLQEKYADTIREAVSYLKKTQDPKDGAWESRWGINTLNGTGAALVGLAAVGEINPRATAFLLSKQNSDGGWGESSLSYTDRSWRGRGLSTPTQTSWVLLALLAASTAPFEASTEINASIDRGLKYLIEFQRLHGHWFDPSCVGTGHPGILYMVYPSYPLTFPLMALSRGLARGSTVKTSPINGN